MGVELVSGTKVETEPIGGRLVGKDGGGRPIGKDSVGKPNGRVNSSAKDRVTAEVIIKRP